MKHTIWTLLLVITVGLLAFAAGWNARTTMKPQMLSLIERAQPHVVLAKSGARQHKDVQPENEGCPVVPNGDVGQQKSNERDSSIMKGLVF